MPTFDVWFAGNADQGYASTIEDAESDFGLPERVTANSEADAVFEFNKALSVQGLAGPLAPEASERYYIRRVVMQPPYIADVTANEDELPIVHARPFL